VIWDRPELLALREGPVVAYDVADAALDGGRARFVWDSVAVELAVPGLHNARNAAAALSAAALAGVSTVDAAGALAGFGGAARRFERLGESATGAEVYDDYAHHPTEIAATLAAARTLAPRRLIAAFQPHLYSRTQALAREFGAALAAADAVVVLDVYAARERSEDFPGVSGLLVAEATADAASGRPTLWMPDRDAAEGLLRELAGAGDVIVVMGAGDIDELGRRLVGGGGGR
jgi:UDP-N-acetylmuramate--alanine ligase